MATNGATWRKSSRSNTGSQGTCVELHFGRNAVRDSKNPQGPTLSIDLHALLGAIKSDRFER
jgi:hypothetical protein